MSKSQEILQKYWGYSTFRPLQEEIIESAVYGHDTLAILSTGAGKSICFQVPGLVREGVCLVVSPLIALMEDQVNNLRKKGIKAEFIVSGMTTREIDIILDNVRFGNVKFLYTSPERIKSKLFIERFKLMNVGLIAVDEAHCISQWGFDFRPSYMMISELRTYQPQVPIIALTATATKQVKTDISEKLHLKNFNYFEGDFARANLSYEVQQSTHKEKDIVEFIFKHPNLSGIVYCQTRKSTKNIAKLLLSQGVTASFYHGGLSKIERTQKQNDWIENKTSVMVATNAFGMGIDKPDVRFVVHNEFPDSLEAYYQEAGRAGRDGSFARSLAFVEEDDVEEIRKMVEARFPPLEQIKLVYRALCSHLGIAIGSGKEETYSFDIKMFLQKYSFDLIETYNSLKILELNETLIFSENALHSTRIKYAVSNITLYNFQLQHETIDPLITLISRSYTGIFDQFVEIDEKQLLKRLSISQQELKRQFIFLEKNGILEVSWRSDIPQVTFLQERLPDNYLTISSEVLFKRKEVALEKMDAVENYLTVELCRSVQLLNYFGQEGDLCGKCDVCLKNGVSGQNENVLAKKIQLKLQEKALTFDELQEMLPNYEKKNIQKVINKLLDANRVVLSSEKLIWKA